MNLKSRRAFAWVTTIFVLGSGCSQKDEGVSASLGDNEDSANADDKPDGGDNPKPSSQGAGGRALDAGFTDPAEAEVIMIAPPDATCAATSQEAKQVTTTKEVVVEIPKEEIKPVAIYLMLDRSSSMVGVCPLQGNCNKDSWTQATQAITAFISDPASAELSVGLGYFPPVVAEADRSATGPLCNGTSCATPAVPIDKASRNASKIEDNMSAAVPPSRAPYTQTPTECAIRGLSSLCKQHKQATGEKCVGVLVTDGVPFGDCNIMSDYLATVTASAAAEGTPIFTLGLTGADFNFLNTIAMSGGTDCTPNADGNACDVSSGKDAFIAALNAIRDTVVVKETRVDKVTTVTEEPIDCEWTIPPPPADQKFDKDKVNVRFSATGMDARTIGHVSSKADCDKFPEGWYFDKEDEPSKVLACGGACDQIKAAKGAKVSIELGCKTELLR